MTFLEGHDNIKHIGDVLAASVTVGTLVNILPSIAAIFTIVWTGMRIFEMFQGNGSIKKWWKKKKRRK